MKNGDSVFFISNGVVMRGVFMGKKDGVALIKYTRGELQRFYRPKITQVATEMEGGTNGRFGKGSNTTGNKRCNVKNGEVSGQMQSNKKGQGAGDQLFVGAWRIRNMA